MRTLNGNTVCYAVVRRDANNHLQVVRLYPVMISRDLHSMSPRELLALNEKTKKDENTGKTRSSSLLPPASIDSLSMAERVFGWVRGKDTQENGADGNAARKVPVNALKGALSNPRCSAEAVSRADRCCKFCGTRYGPGITRACSTVNAKADAGAVLQRR